MTTVAAMAPPLSIARIAELERAAFVQALGDLFEHSAWVAEAAWSSRPFASADALHASMMDAVRASEPARIVAFLCQHPELAGREAEAGTMTGHSTFEQRGAGLDALSRDELAELRRLNAAYREAHAFPFIIAVLGHDKAQIFEALRRRVGNATAAERDEALAQVGLITRRRLDALLGSA